MNNAEHEALGALEATMRRERLRAHVYIAGEGTVVSFATTTRPAAGELRRNAGPEPVAAAWRRIERTGKRMPDWSRLARQSGPGGIAGAIWNSPHLVVTGVSPPHALVMAAPHAAAHGRALIRKLAALAGTESSAEIARWHTEASTLELPAKARRQIDAMLQDD